MASVRKRVSKQGVTTYAVLFRHDGKQTSETFETSKAAEDFAALVDIIGPTEARDRLNGTARAGGLTVDELAEYYFDFKRPDVTERTLADYRRGYNNWIKPWFGHRAAEYIDERDVQQWVDHMKSQLDAKTVKGHHVLLGALYRYGSARSRRLVEHDPCRETQLPKPRRKAPRGFTLAEWAALYDANHAVRPDATDLALFLVLTGWRWSEAAALPAGAVEDYGDQMFVTVTQVNRRDASLRFVVVADAKNYTSLRRIEVTPATAQLLRRRIAGKGPQEFVFTGPNGGRWYQQNFLNRTWTAMLKAASLPHEGEGRKTPHALRHTHIAMLDRAGATIPQMSRRAGHSDVRTTINVYGGMIDNISAEVLAGLDALALPTPASTDVIAGSVIQSLVTGEQHRE